jgi:hypothetical protein
MKFLTVFTVAACCLLCPLAFAAESPTDMPLVYSTDFSAGADDWVPTDAKAWKIIQEGGRNVYSLFQASDYKAAVRSPFNQSYIKGLVVSDFVMDVEAKATKEEYPHRDLCFFFGKQDDTHLYYVHIAPTAKEGDPHAHSIFIVNGKDRVSIVETRMQKAKWSDTHYRKVRIVRDTNTGSIEVFFQHMHEPIMTATDKTFTTGMVGVGSFDDTGNFKSVQVWGKKVK